MQHIKDALTPYINDENNTMLTTPFNMDEFTNAIFDIHIDKSLGYSSENKYLKPTTLD